MIRGNLLSQKAEFIVNMLQTRSDSGADGDKRRRPEAECSNSPPKSFVKFISCNNLVQAKNVPPDWSWTGGGHQPWTILHR